MTGLEIAIGAQALSALAQAYQAEQARGAADDRLKKIEKMFMDLKPPQYDMSIMDPPELIADSIPEPAFDLTNFTPEMYELVGQYQPEVAQYIATEAPELVQMSEVGQEGLSAQRKALERLMQISEGEDPLLQSRFAQAGRAAQQEAQSRQQSQLQQAQRRGMLTSGLGAAAQMQAGATAMDRMAGLGAREAEASYENALRALSQSGAIGGQMAGQDFNRQQANANIRNRFNEMTSRNYQNYLQYRSDLQNKAQLQNLQAAQELEDRNVGQRNQADLYNRARSDRMAEAGYERQLAERDYQNRLAQQQAEWQRGERDRRTGLQSQQYQDLLGQTQGRAGISGQRSNLEMQHAQDRNRMIQAGSDVVSDYYKYQIGQRDKDKERQFYKDLFESYNNSYPKERSNPKDDTKPKPKPLPKGLI